MRPKLSPLLWGLMALAPAGAVADEHERPQPYIYATYMNCDLTGQERADEIVEKYLKKVYADAVAAGTINSWGWLAHHTGGKWRRLNYYTAPTIEALLEAGDALAEKTDEIRQSEELAEICGSHDDYIWRSNAGSGGAVATVERGKVGMSVYHVCDMTKESRADAIVKHAIGPVFDDHTGKGKLTSWGWSTHVVGGKYRRLSTMTAGDWPTLFKMRNAIFDALDGNELADEFSEICGSHTDYMWDIQHEKR